MTAFSPPLANAPRITTDEELARALEAPGSCLVVKHSLTCGTSGAGLREVEAAIEALGLDIPAYVVEVQRARALSNLIAQRFEVRHESPQALLFRDGALVWNASHWAIERRALATVLSPARSDG